MPLDAAACPVHRAGAVIATEPEGADRPTATVGGLADVALSRFEPNP